MWSLSRHRLPVFAQLKCPAQRSSEKDYEAIGVSIVTGSPLLSSSTSGIPSCHPCREFSRRCNSGLVSFLPSIHSVALSRDGSTATIGSLSNYDDHYNDDFKKTIVLMIKTTALHVHHAF